MPTAAHSQYSRPNIDHHHHHGRCPQLADPAYYSKLCRLVFKFHLGVLMCDCSSVLRCSLWPDLHLGLVKLLLRIHSMCTLLLHLHMQLLQP